MRQGLIAAGRIEEPLVGLNANDQYWVEDRSWWLRKSFAVTASTLAAQAVELDMYGLDANASIFLNGVHVGDHPSAFRPFVADVKSLLRKGGNILLVRLTHGIENVTPEMYEPMLGFQPTEDGRGRPERGDRRRTFVRKPQYVWGWDWTPRVATVCISGDVKLRAINQAIIRDVAVVAHRREEAKPQATRRIPPKASATKLSQSENVDLQVTATVQWIDPFRSGWGTVVVKVADESGKTIATAKYSGMLQSGNNYIDLTLPIKNARLWWPSGMGEQYRYTVTAELMTGNGFEMAYTPIRYGIRFIELEVDGVFAFRVNGQRMYVKGGNFVPADALYARVSTEKYDRLVKLAAGANLNMLRVWGGGLYEREAFYEACDREGLLVWQEFMLACSPYPDHIETFRDEVAKEADFQTKRLRNHACMALWCGSNEVLYCTSQGSPRETDKATRLLGSVFPEAVRRNCRETPYWYTSPSGGEQPDSWAIGDCHFWAVPMHMDREQRYNLTLFEQCEALFISEYGYPGPCGLETTLEYLDGAGYDTTRDEQGVWMHHTNTFDQGALDLAIRNAYIDPAKCSLEEYIYFGGMMQSVMYGYTLETLRSKRFCNGAIFWMYEDAWGEVGWTIVDYYARTKPAYWAVRRAFSPQRLIMRTQTARGGDKIAVTLANDTLQAVKGTLEYGYVSLDGKRRKTNTKTFNAPAMARTVVATFKKGQVPSGKGVWFCRETSSKLAPASLWDMSYRRLHVSKPTVKLTLKALTAKTVSNAKAKIAGPFTYTLTLTSDAYAHGADITLPQGASASDNLMDLMPGVPVVLTVTSPAPITSDDIRVRTAWDYMERFCHQQMPTSKIETIDIGKQIANPLGVTVR